MRYNLLKIFLITILFALASCGSATDVGNPSGELPTTQVLSGQVDGATITLDVAAAASKLYAPKEEAGDDEGGVGASVDDLSQFVMYATSEDGTQVFNDALDAAGLFAIEVASGYIYSFDLRLGDMVVGQFNFKQDAAGDRGPHLNVRRIGRDIDMGVVRFENGEFVPEFEPFDEMEAEDHSGGMGDGFGGGGSN